MLEFLNLFKLPKNNYQDLYDIARLKLTWRVSVVVFIGIAIFSIVSIIFTPEYTVAMITSLISLVIILSIMKVSGKYKLSAKLFVIFSISISITQLFLASDMMHFVDLIWYLVEVIFAYFVLGKRWGTIALASFAISLVLYICFVFDSHALKLQELTLSIKFFQSVNAIVVAWILGYIISHFTETNKSAENELLGINKNLSEKQIIIESQNDMNEVMFKEIHHRVKNNLQIISSLLKLQSYETESTEVQNHFYEAIGRIRSMALIHEKMYSNDNLAKINLQSYLINLSSDICESMNAKDDIKLKIQSELEMVDVKSMVPLSLIFNELITNSLKHGIKSTLNGEINIEIKSNSSTTSFYYSDNGTWAHPKRENSFGIELIETLTQQLDGEVNRSVDAGTSYTFTFQTKTLFYS